jgi:hypothetical protein
VFKDVQVLKVSKVLQVLKVMQALKVFQGTLDCRDLKVLKVFRVM